MINKQKEVWDKEYGNNFNKWNLESKKIAEVMRGKKVLELGVGNGKSLKSISRQKPYMISAIDFSKEAIERCRKEFDKEIKFVLSDIKEMPFNDAEFDVIVSYYVLNNMIEEERKKAVSEIKRVLKEKGTVLFEDFQEGDFRENSKGDIVEKHTLLKKNGLICHFFNENEIRNLFCDFKDIKIESRESNPILYKKELLRKIISAVIKK